MIDLLLHADEYLALWASDYGFIVYGILFLIIFAETGLVVTPFLPGDSLLFAAGALAATGALRLDILLGVMAVAAMAMPATAVPATLVIAAAVIAAIRIATVVIATTAMVAMMPPAMAMPMALVMSVVPLVMADGACHRLPSLACRCGGGRGRCNAGNGDARAGAADAVP